MQKLPRILLDVCAQTISFNGKVLKLNHGRAALFLQLLIEAKNRNNEVGLLHVKSLWNFAQPPDRKAIDRLIKAVEKGMNDLLGGALQRLVYQPRHQTTGPWRLIDVSGEKWEVASTPDISDTHTKENPQQESLIHPQHVRLAQTDAGVLALLESLLIADGLSIQDANHEQAYVELAAALNSKILKANLTAEGHALLWLRAARYARLHGNLKNARAALKFASNYCNKCEASLAKQSLKQSCDLLLSRVMYVVDWEASKNADFMSKLYASLEGGVNAHYLWEFANLVGLSKRRIIEGKGGNFEKIAASTDGQSWFNTGLFWILLDEHWLHIQAACLNHAYFLFALEEFKVNTPKPSAIDWLAIACKITRRFHHKDDCPHDYFFIAKIWLAADSVRRKKISEKEDLRIGDFNPKTPNFWNNMLKVTKKFGTEEQIKYANKLSGRNTAQAARVA